MLVAPALLPILLGVCLLTVAALAWIGWLATAQIGEPRLRWLGRFALILPIGWCGPAAGRWALAPSDVGRWGCRVCFDYRKEVRYWGWTLWTDEPKRPCEAGSHEWKAVGCHQVGLTDSALYWYAPY